MQTPLSKCRVSAVWSEDVVGALDQQTSEIGVASLGDAELRIAFTGLAASWPQAEIAAYVTTSPETLLIPGVRTKVRAVMWPTPWIVIRAWVSAYSV